jgi:hypothetical protein
LLTLQGVAEVLRCMQCLRQGRWEPRLHDVEELENQILRQAQVSTSDADAMRARAERGETK